MIINKLILRNFRIFNGTHEFDFSNSKVVVIDGPNGHGKSTVFDAINWVLSGKINRYTGSSEYQQFNYLINSAEYKRKNPHASVEITLTHGEEVINIKRLIKNKSIKLFINEKAFKLNEGQKLINELLVKKNRAELVSGFEVSNSKIDMAAFLASTTILSQEGLESFVRSDKPIERYAILEKVLGLTRYGEDFRVFLNKLEKKGKEIRDDLEETRKHLVHKKEILDTKYEQKMKYNNRLGIINEEDLTKKINSFFFNQKINNINSVIITEISERQLAQFKELKEKSLVSINELNGIKESIKRTYLIESNNMLIESSINNSMQQLVELETKKNKRIQSIDETKNRIKEILNITRDIKRIETINIQIKNTDLEIKKIITFKDNIISELLKVYNEDDQGDLSSFSNKYENWIYLLEQYNELLELSKNKQRLLEVEDSKKTVEESLFECNKQKELLAGKINELNVIAKTMVDKQTSRKESYINRIVNEIQEQILTSESLESCLVCGNRYSDVNELKESVRKQLESSYEELSNLDKQVRKVELEKSTEINKQEEIFKNIKKLEIEKDKINSTINQINEKVTRLLARIDGEIKEAGVEMLAEKIPELESLIKNYQYKYNLSKEAQRIQTEIEKIVYEKHILENEKKDLISKSRKINRYIDNPDIARIKKDRMDNYIYKADLNIKELDNQKNTERIKILEEKDKLDLLIEYSGKMKELLNIPSLDLDGNLLNSLASESVESKTIYIKKIDELSSEVASFLNNKELFTLEKEILECKKELESNESTIDRNRIIASQLIKFNENHREVQSNLINGYLNELTGEINNFYRQISPHAYYDYLSLKVKENELFILLSEEKFEEDEERQDDLKDYVNASLTLSAAQSTVLAMSIFLALNTSQNWSKLSILGIDDPFQNLDDINIYSFIDVISFLIKEEKKQIFISTHHQDFSKLIASKLGLNRSHFTHVAFQSYTQETVSVKSDCYKHVEE